MLKQKKSAVLIFMLLIGGFTLSQASFIPGYGGGPKQNSYDLKSFPKFDFKDFYYYPDFSMGTGYNNYFTIMSKKGREKGFKKFMGNLSYKPFYPAYTYTGYNNNYGYSWNKSPYTYAYNGYWGAKGKSHHYKPHTPKAKSTSVPEPSLMILLSAGLIGLVTLRKKVIL